MAALSCSPSEPYMSLRNLPKRDELGLGSVWRAGGRGGGRAGAGAARACVVGRAKEVPPGAAGGGGRRRGRRRGPGKLACGSRLRVSKRLEDGGRAEDALGEAYRRGSRAGSAEAHAGRRSLRSARPTPDTGLGRVLDMSRLVVGAGGARCRRGSRRLGRLRRRRTCASRRRLCGPAARGGEEHWVRGLWEDGCG